MSFQSCEMFTTSEVSGQVQHELCQLGALSSHFCLIDGEKGHQRVDSGHVVRVFDLLVVEVDDGVWQGQVPPVIFQSFQDGFPMQVGQSGSAANLKVSLAVRINCHPVFCKMHVTVLWTISYTSDFVSTVPGSEDSRH